MPTAEGYDGFLWHVLAENPDFQDLETLTRQIETESINFINDIEYFLANND